ncbi:uncharacterized protein [Haliotis cracherodii]|uniref:uncharacterized protein n=1 Tax=Haliotis cracherodii TaxID=6455 RepID=UPI0039EB18C5
MSDIDKTEAERSEVFMSLKQMETIKKEELTGTSYRLRTLTEKGSGMYKETKDAHCAKLAKAQQELKGILKACSQYQGDLKSLRLTERSLAQVHTHYCELSSAYIDFLRRTNTLDSNNDLDLHLQNYQVLKSEIEITGKLLDHHVRELIDSSSYQSKSIMRTSKSGLSNTSSSLASKRAKAEAARARAEYAVKEAEILKQRALLEEQQQLAAAHASRKKADMDADLKLLKEQKKVAGAEAEVRALQLEEDSQGSSSHFSLPVEGAKDRTRDYVARHSQNQTSNISVPRHYFQQEANRRLTSPSPPLAQQGPVNVLPDTNIPCAEADLVYSVAHQGDGIENIHRDEGNNMFVAAELSRFLLKKELLLTRLTSFNDRPESYAIWKLSFLRIIAELQATDVEEFDLLVKWLGPASSKYANSLRAANVQNPSRGLERIWARLDERYGCPEMVEAARKNKLAAFPRLTYKNSELLYELSDLLSEVESIKGQDEYKALLSYFDSSAGVIPIVNKLPYGLQERWTSHATRYKRTNKVSFPPFSIFVDFVRDISKEKNDPSFAHETYTASPRKDRSKPPLVAANRKTEVTQETRGNQDWSKLCPVHKTDHSLNQCKAFKLKTIEDRKALIKRFGICYRCCLTSTHLAKACREFVKCAFCGSSRHATALHVVDWEQQNSETGTPSPRVNDGGERKDSPSDTSKFPIASKCTQICGDGFAGKSCSKTVLVKVYPEGRPDMATRMYAMFDDQSNASLVMSEFFTNMEADGEVIPYTLSSCAGRKDTSGWRAKGYIVESFDGHSRLQLPTLIECNQIPDHREEIPVPEVAMHYNHLKDIANCIPPLDNDAQILLLIGRDLIEAHHVLDQRIGPNKTPYGQKLSLGWVIVGETCLGKVHQPKQVTVNKTYILSDGRPSIFKPCDNHFQVKEGWSSGNEKNKVIFTARERNGQNEDKLFVTTQEDDKLGLSVEDREFLEIMDNEMVKTSEGNWIAPLSFRNGRRRLPNNRSQALNRAKTLDRCLKRDTIKRQQFLEFMQRILDNDHAELAPPLTEDEERWYLPLFGVYHPKKPDQLRAVFDSSANHEGTSLNDVLLNGPDLANSLVGVLLRFRRESTAVMADIQQMFYCFLVKEEHRNFLRFLWYKDNDINQELVEYRMKVHVFGNSPSPAVATYGLRRSAKSVVETYGKDVQLFVERDFYVDDGLTCLQTTEQAIDLIKRTQQALLSGGNLRLHKVASNDPEVMKTFPSDDLAKDLKDLDLGSDLLPVQRSLGMAWDLQSDSFTFKVSADPKPYTKRGILSTINSLFDPMGFAAPVTIRGKILFRDLISGNSDWDQPLPSASEREWEDWKDSLTLLEELKIPRTYVPVSFQGVITKEIHVFSDASEKAVAAVAYLRTVDKDKGQRTGFILGKAKVAPMHGHTIPRLELCAAVLAVEIADLVCEHLGLPLDVVQYYTDSKIVLGYIYNQTRRFYVYVSNRIDRIRKYSQPEQWHYVHSDKNPADIGTRSIHASQLNSSIWLSGPTPISQDSCAHTFILTDEENDKELRPAPSSMKTKVCNTSGSLDTRYLEKFSSWESLVRAFTLLKCMARKIQNKDPLGINSDTLKETERFLMKMVQYRTFGAEIDCLLANSPIPRNSTILSLHPKLDEHGILCVGGSLNKSDFDARLKNPTIIPGDSHLARLLVHHHHSRVKHQGRTFTEGAVRSAGLWITGAKRVISSLIYKCVSCRKLRGRQQYQKMADLPSDRLMPSPPFTYVGLDTFGPWFVVTRRTRGGQANNKRWAVLFTCLTTRAIHIEVVEELSSSSFINALRRFISIRGPVKQLRSDRGTNFVGATDALKINVVNVEDNSIKRFLDDERTK